MANVTNDQAECSVAEGDTRSKKSGDVDRDEFYRRVDELLTNKRGVNSFLINREKYNKIIEQVKKAKTTNKKTPIDFRRCKRYDIIDSPTGERLLLALQTGQKKQQMYVPLDEVYDIIRSYHIREKHAGRSKMMTMLKKDYKNITTELVLLYLSLCKDCKVHKASRSKYYNRSQDSLDDLEDAAEEIYQTERVNLPDNDSLDPFDSQDCDESNDNDSVRNNTIATEADSAPVVVYPELYARGQVDILEVTSSQTEDYKYLMVYRDIVTKFTHLRPMKASNIDETVEALLEIFLVFGAPNILQSSNGMPVTMPICRRITALCPDIRIVAGETTFSAREFVGKSNEDVLQKLNEWLTSSKSSIWQQGIKYVQRELNTTFHPMMGRTPSELVFGGNPRKGLASVLPPNESDLLTTEQELKKLLEDKRAIPVQQQFKLKLLLIPPNEFIKDEPNIDEDDFMSQ